MEYESKTIITTGEKLNKKKLTSESVQITKEEQFEKEFMDFGDGDLLAFLMSENLTSLKRISALCSSKTNSLQKKDLTYLEKKYNELWILLENIRWIEFHILGCGLGLSSNRNTKRKNG